MAIYEQNENQDIERQALIQGLRRPSRGVPAAPPVLTPVGAPGPAPDAADKLPDPPKTDYTTLGSFANRLGAWTGNTEKLNRSWDDKSERYKMLTVQSHFDPNAGITPEMIEALNAANIHGAKFSGSRDKLTVDNAGGWDRFGTGGTGDVIERFDPENTNKQWSPWAVDEPTGAGTQARGPAQQSAAGLQTSDAVNALTQDSTYNSLQAKLQQILGAESTDRDALLRLLQQGQ